MIVSSMTSRRLLAVAALLFLSHLNRPSSKAAAATDASDVTALQTLYSHWQSDYSNIQQLNWQGGDPCGSSWSGVTCDVTGEHVVELDLKSLNLTGGIPSTIGDLASLTLLDLSFNEQLGGVIPPELCQLTTLQKLIVIDCGLSGSLPDNIGQLTNLKYLTINHNNISGQIPATIGNLVQLTWCDLSENALSGPIPISTSISPGLDSLSSAQHFHFNNNSLSGNVPDELFNLPSLVHLLLDSNEFTGPIPTDTLLNAEKMTVLRLDNNFLTGAIPPELNEVTTLTELVLSRNNFTQTLPDLSNLTNLQLIDVSDNPFDQQEIPPWIYLMKSARTIIMESANLTGPLKSSIFSLPAIQYLSLSDNLLNGSVSFGYPSSTLTVANLQNNNFSDYDGSSSNGINTTGIRLGGNPLCNSFGGSQVCQPFTDAPQTWVAPANPYCPTDTCTGGKALNPNLCNCAYRLFCQMQLTLPSFTIANVSEIQFISDEWAKGFSNSTLGIYLDTRQVYIGNANFTDKGRLLFDLSFFPLYGDSMNDTEVRIILAALSSGAVKLKEGPYLLRSFLRPSLFPSSKSSKVSTGIIVGVVVAGVVVALVILLIAAYAIRQKKRADKAEISRPFASWGGTTKEGGEAPQLKGARWFSLAELKQATNNFSSDNELGVGGYGTVYRAVLPGGDVVAVKRAMEGSLQGDAEFKTEIELLSRVHHRNLVGLVGFCYEAGEQALVYEYMPNGTLRDHLLGYFEFPLSWAMRVGLALGSARGLAYLHELANPPIIHRDIKSGNILLDEKMVAKVADFGLSKLVPDEADKNPISSQVKGTMGYLDPEYYTTTQLSEKSDVYSFGVVLLEMLSARPPIERGKYIVREVKTALDKGGIKALAPLLDPFLGEYPPRQLEAFLDVALQCVEEVAVSRPTMNEVVRKLEAIDNQSQPSAGVHITVEPQKAHDLYNKESLKKVDNPSFQYSGVSFTAHARVEPK